MLRGRCDFENNPRAAERVTFELTWHGGLWRNRKARTSQAASSHPLLSFLPFPIPTVHGPFVHIMRSVALPVIIAIAATGVAADELKPAFKVTHTFYDANALRFGC